MEAHEKAGDLVEVVRADHGEGGCNKGVGAKRRLPEAFTLRTGAATGVRAVRSCRYAHKCATTQKYISAPSHTSLSQDHPARMMSTSMFALWPMQTHAHAGTRLRVCHELGSLMLDL